MENRQKILVMIKPNPKSSYTAEHRLDIELKDQTSVDDALMVLKGMMRLPFDDLDIKHSRNGNPTEIKGTEVKPYKPGELDEIFDTIKSNLRVLGFSE